MPAGTDDRDAFTRDLIALLALPFVWRDLPASAICGELLDVTRRLVRTDAVGLRLSIRSQVVLERPLPEGQRGALELSVDRESIALVLTCACAREGFPTTAERALVRAALDQAWLSIRVSQLMEDERRASESKDQFLAVLSHELRTPLNAILGWAAMLRGGSLPAEGVKKAVETIERNARVQTKLVDDLLDLSRIVYGKIDLEPTDVDLASVLALIVESLRLGAAERGVSLALEGAEAGPIVRGDPARLQQVFGNLVGNAIKFTPAGGRVTVSLGGGPAWCTVSVVDTGRGIEPSMLPSVFDPFRQRDRGDARAGGLGLGLAISKRLIDMHGGTIQASSAGPGTGASFVVRLPRSARRIAALPTTARLDAWASLRGARLLVVDDHDDSREVIAGLLAAAGATVEVASSVEAALERLAVWRPDVVVCDIQMPLQTGHDLVRAIRGSAAHAAVRAVALTAYAHREDRERALREGFDDYLAKPVDADALLRVVGAQLRRE